MNRNQKTPQITAVIGELQNHSQITSRIKGALQGRDFNLIILFPTLSLLNVIQQEVLNDPGVPGIGGIRFLLFEGFMEEICQRFGINQRRPSSLERNLLITQSFRKSEASGDLSYLSRAPFTAGYRQAILQGIAEWKRSQLTPDVFRQWAATKGPKEQQLALLYQDYQNYLTKYGFTEDDHILTQLVLQGRQGFDKRRSKVLLYGFTDLTQLQRSIIDTLSVWFELEIMIDPTIVPSFQKLSARYFNIPFLATTADALKSGLEVLSTEHLPEMILNRLQNRFWTGEPEVLPFSNEDSSLSLFQTAGLYRQAAVIAREIAMLFKEHPEYSIRDILILNPEPDRFIRTAAPVFKDYQIPLTVIPTPIIDFPSINHIRNLLTTNENDWQWTDFTVLIRYLYEEDPATGDRLVNVIGERYGALSGRERWLRLVENMNFRLYLHESGLNMEPLLGGIEWLKRIPACGSLKDYLKVIRDLTEKMIFEKAKHIFHEEQIVFPEGRQRRIQNYQAIQMIQNTVEELISFVERVSEWQFEVNLSEFLHFFNDYCLDLEVEMSTPAEYGIKVLPPREARGLKAPVVFLTGLVQGVFPRTYINDWKLDIQSRFELKTKGIELETGEHYMFQERLAFYWAIQSATKQLFLVYQDQDEAGQPLNRSLFLDEILEWVPELSVRTRVYPLAPYLPEVFGDCLSDTEIRRCWARSFIREMAGLPEMDKDRFQAMLLLDTYRQLAGQIRKCHHRKLGPTVPMFHNPASIQRIANLFGAEFTFAITALEDYRECPYRFFLKHVLKTTPSFGPSLFPTKIEVGSLLHQVLEDFGANYRGCSLQPDNVREYEKYLIENFHSRYREWRDGAANELIKLLLKLQESQIERILGQWLKSEMDWARETQQRFHIRNVEFGFGLVKGDYDPDSLPRPFQLMVDQPTEEVKIWGKIDRVDLDSAGNFIVYDYKTGRGPSVKNIMNFDYLQIPVYIMALEQLGPGAATGGSYLELRQPSRNRCGIWREGKLEMQFKGMLNETAWQKWLTDVRELILNNVQSIRHGAFNLVGEKCGPYCAYRDVCRRWEWEVDGADGLSIESRAV